MQSTIPTCWRTDFKISFLQKFWTAAGELVTWVRFTGATASFVQINRRSVKSARKRWNTQTENSLRRAIEDEHGRQMNCSMLFRASLQGPSYFVEAKLVPVRGEMLLTYQATKAPDDLQIE